MKALAGPGPRFALAALAALAVVGPREAWALQPLSDFVSAAATGSFDAREQAAVLAQRNDEASQAWWKLAPVLGASGVYTRNQYPAVATIPLGATGKTESVTIMAQDQLDATFSATVPIVDVGAWERVHAARRTAASASAQVEATRIDVQRAVAQGYYQVVASEAVLRSATTRRDTAKANLDVVRTRNAAGVAGELDLKRATAELESARQDVAEAEYQIRVARRSLATASGLEPSPGGAELADDTSPEPPLESFTAGVSLLPAVRAATESARAAERTVDATRAGLYPTVSATAQERITNAPGFGQSPYYQLLATATWKFDGSTIPGTAAAARAADAAHVREERARREADDAVYVDYQAVVRQTEKTLAARAQHESTALAAGLARQRYEAGTATYLDVQTAERDDFTAEVALIQASADLAYARVALRLAAGRPLDARRAGP